MVNYSYHDLAEREFEEVIPDVEYFVDNLSALDSDYFASNSLMSINLKLKLW